MEGAKEVIVIGIKPTEQFPGHRQLALLGALLTLPLSAHPALRLGIWFARVHEKTAPNTYGGRSRTRRENIRQAGMRGIKTKGTVVVGTSPRAEQGGPATAAALAAGGDAGCCPPR